MGFMNRVIKQTNLLQGREKAHREIHIMKSGPNMYYKSKRNKHNLIDNS